MKRNPRTSNISFYKVLTVKIFKLYIFLRYLYYNHLTIRMIFKFFYYIYKFIIFISFIFGGGFILTITHIVDLSISLQRLYDLKDILFTQLIHSMLNYISDPTFLSDKAKSKIFNSFPKVEAPEQIPSKDQNLREKYSKHTRYSWYETELTSEDKPFYQDKWFILGCLSLVTIGLTWYFYDDISNYFKGDDTAGAATTAKGKFIDSTRAELDKAKLSRLERFKRNLSTPDSSPKKTISRSSSTSSTDTIKLNPGVDAAVITSTGDVTNTVATSSNSEAASRLRFSPQHGSKEEYSEYRSLFKSPDSPDSSNSSGSLDSPTTHGSSKPTYPPYPPKAPLPGEKGSFFNKIMSPFKDLPESDEWNDKNK